MGLCRSWVSWAAGLLLTVGACPVSAQEAAPPAEERGGGGNAFPRPQPGYELRAYDVAGLIRRIEDRLPPRLELVSPAQTGGFIGASFTLEEPAPGFVPADGLPAVVRELARGEPWPEDRTSLEVNGNWLWCVQTPAGQAGVEAALARLAQRAGVSLEVEGTIARVDDAWLEDWRANGPNAVELPEGFAAALEEALAQGTAARRLATLRGRARNGEMTSFWNCRETSYVCDYDLEVGDFGAQGDPVIGVLALGGSLGVRPRLWPGDLCGEAADRMLCEVRFRRQEGTLPVPTFDTGVASVAPIGLPETLHAAVETTVVARAGRTVLAGRAAAGGGRSECFFLRMEIVPVPGGPAPGPAAPAGVIDVRALTSALTPFPAGRFGMAGWPVPADASEEGEPPVFSLQVTDIEAAAAGGAGTEAGLRGGLVYVGADGAVAAADRLRALADARLRMIVTRALVVAVEASGYEAFAREFISAGGEALSPASAAALMARVRAGGGVTLLASGEVAGMDGQRVHVTRDRRQAYVKDYDQELASQVGGLDPQIDVAAAGIVVACRPRADAGGKGVEAETRVAWAEFDGPFQVAATRGDGARIQVPSLVVGEFQGTFSVPTGRFVVVGTRGAIPIGGVERHVVAYLRCDPVPR